jgi:hypothetical protein
MLWAFLVPFAVAMLALEELRKCIVRMALRRQRPQAGATGRASFDPI